MQSLKIGNVRIPNQLFLSPMVDVTDLAYRQLCREQGAGMAYTEMLYVDAIIHENKRTLSLMKTNKSDKPIGIQITGNSIAEFKKAIPYLKNYDLVDINCGCPSIRITGNQAGSYLLKNPEKIAGMIKVLKNAGLVVTAKIRLGFKTNNVMKISKEIEKAGADLLTVHARLAYQGASVPADWKYIKKVKDEIGIPVIGNGDIKDGKSAAEMLDLCDGAMIARAAIGNPFIFRQVINYLKTGKEVEATPKERISSFAKYLTLAEKYKIEDISRAKYLGANFISGFRGASEKRNELMKLKTFKEIKGFAKKLTSEKINTPFASN